MEEIELKNLNDSHFHIKEMIDKDIDFEEFINNWIKLGGKKLIDIGIEETDYVQRKEYARNYNFIYHTVGIHPNNAGGDIEYRFKILENHLKNDINNKIVGIGETGLDYYWDTVEKKVQKEFFIRHIELSIKYNLPLIIHNRDACSDIVDILKLYNGKISGIIHCFSSETKYLHEFLELGFYISYAGNVTYKKNIKIQASLKSTPIDRLLIETDSPYLSPIPLRGKLNTPNNIGFTFDYILDNLEISKESLKNKLTENLIKIFKLREKS